MDTLVVPAIIAKMRQELNEMFNYIPTMAQRIQLNVMDGDFVPNISLNFSFKLPTNSWEYEAH
jgi:pentose-5-phosphate-3-epimerase